MATHFDTDQSQSSASRSYRADQGFFLVISVTLSLLIVIGFGQLALRGIRVPADYPARVHLHLLLMVSWLAVFSAQNWLAYKGRIALHRRLGWVAMALVAAIVVANLYVTIMKIVDGRLNPIFTPGQFVSLGTVDTLAFSGLVAWAVIQRHHLQWHRRLMFGATLMLAAAGFNRFLVPMDRTIADAISAVFQIGFLTILARHDFRLLGHVHKATALVFVIVPIQHLAPGFLGGVPIVAKFGESLLP